MAIETQASAPSPVTVVQQPMGGSPENPRADSGRAARVGMWALGLGFGGFLLWAGLAPLDEGVPTQGAVSIDTKRKVVQHPDGGIIRQVHVREGETVKEGQVLITLDADMARANLESIRHRYLGFRAMEGRLKAEQSGLRSVTFHPDLVAAAAADVLIRQQVVTQEQLFQSRRAALAAELQAFEEASQAQQAMLQSYESMLVSRQGQAALLKEELGHTRELVKEGYAPRNRQLELERMVAESSAQVADLTGNLTRTRRAIAELRQRIVTRQQEYRKEVETALAEIARDVDADAQKVTVAKGTLDRIEIRSPAAGQVVDLQIQTVGGVIRGGDRLLDVVPGGAPLLLEAKIPPHMIDKVHAGLDADVRFSAFAHSPQLVVGGKVQSVSGDLLSEQTGNGTYSYYLARVAITPEGLKELGNRQMQPGMPVEVVIKTGARSLLTYLLHPLTKRIAASMKEE
jgi:membrane fusion protein, protease secretion system